MESITCGCVSTEDSAVVTALIGRKGNLWDRVLVRTSVRQFFCETDGRWRCALTQLTHSETLKRRARRRASQFWQVLGACRRRYSDFMKWSRKAAGVRLHAAN